MKKVVGFMEENEVFLPKPEYNEVVAISVERFEVNEMKDHFNRFASKVDEGKIDV